MNVPFKREQWKPEVNERSNKKLKWQVSIPNGHFHFENKTGELCICAWSGLTFAPVFFLSLLSGSETTPEVIRALMNNPVGVLWNDKHAVSKQCMKSTFTTPWCPHWRKADINPCSCNSGVLIVCLTEDRSPFSCPWDRQYLFSDRSITGKSQG